MAQNKRLADDQIAKLKAAKEAETAKAAEAKMDVDKTDVVHLPSVDQNPQAKEIMSAEEERGGSFQARQRKAELAHLERKKDWKRSQPKTSKESPKESRHRTASHTKTKSDEITQGATKIINKMFQVPIQNPIPIHQPTNPDETHDEQMSDVTIMYDFQTNA